MQAAAAEAAAKSEVSAEVSLTAGQLKTEVETLAKLLKPNGDSALPPVLDAVKVATGYELALAAALGDDLDAPAAAEAPVRWSLNAAGAPDAALPRGAEPLIAQVVGPPELARRLQQIGVVRRTDGARLQKVLKPGQRLVSIEGDLWRWDGFVAAAQGALAAASRLQGAQPSRHPGRPRASSAPGRRQGPRRGRAGRRAIAGGADRGAPACASIGASVKASSPGRASS